MLRPKKECSFILTLIMLLMSQSLQPYHRDHDLERLSLYSLNRYSRKVYSQSGEDGVIEEIFNRIGMKEGFFVEFGANDGITLSNSRYLWEKGWSGAMIESDSTLFSKLYERYRNKPRMICINAFVSFEGATITHKQAQTFDEIASNYFPDIEIDFLSIDIDGPDYLILESLECQPKVICIEGVLAWHPLLNVRIPDKFAVRNLHQPLPIMIAIAKDKGYAPICVEGGNVFFIRNDFAHFFSRAPKDAVTLWRDCWRGLPEASRNYIINWRKKNNIIHSFEGDLNTKLPITKDF